MREKTSDPRGIGRRDFFKVGAWALGGLALRPGRPNAAGEFPEAERLGRVCVAQVDLRAAPSADAASVDLLPADTVVPWLQSVVGNTPFRVNQRWVETPNGYLYAPSVQPVRNEPNEPASELPGEGAEAGMWVEVTVPWVDVQLANPPARAPWLKAAERPRFYYSQIFWADEIRQDEGGDVWYRLNEEYGFGDIFWARAEAFRPLAPEEISPIRPEAENKKVVVDVSHQTMHCYEGEEEVYFCRVSTGSKFDAEGNPVEEWSTPLGPHPIWRKVISMHMVGGTTGGGYDLPGIGWTTLFVGNGVAIHSTFWHNDFGVARSHGCVNARPEDAKWVFRWVDPPVAYRPGDVTIGMPGGTRVEVVEV